MKRTTLILLPLLMAACAGAPSSTPGQKAQQMTLAVLPLHNDTGDASLDATGAALADVVSARLIGLKGFRLIERRRLQEIASEARLAMTGLTDEGSALQLGKLAGASALALGSYSKVGDKAVVSLRVVKSETGEILGAATERGSGVSKLDQIADRAAKKLADALAR